MKFLFNVFLVICLLAVAMPASALWNEGGNVFCDATGSQQYVQSIYDGNGNTILVWTDNRSGNSDVYAQKIDVNGNALWAEDGIAIADGVTYQYDPKIISDGAGGATILWEEGYMGTYGVKAMRIDGDGVDAWASEAVLVTHTSGIQVGEVISDMDGGIICAWYSSVSGNFDIYAQRVDVDGTVLWGASGVALCTDPGNQQQPWLCTDEAGGAIVAWIDYRSTSWDIYARRVSPSGSLYWSNNGVAVCTDASSQGTGEIVSDGTGGAIISWSDSRSGTHDIYAQRLNSGGTAQWTTDGVTVCNAADNQSNVVGLADGEGGAILFWSDDRTNIDDLYVQRIDDSGSAQWTSNGVLVCANSSQQLDKRAVLSESGSAIVTWNDNRTGTTSAYAQMISSGGSPQWTSNGVLLSSGDLRADDPVISLDGEGGAIVAWHMIDGAIYDIMAQRVERNGYWGYPAPVIADVRDIPGDQGGSVDLAFYGSRIDPWPEMDISEYTVWRAIDHPEAMALASEGARIIDSACELPSFDDKDPGALMTDAPVKDIIRRETVGTTTYFWKLVSTIEPYYLDAYSEVVETLFDSTSISDEYHYFQVIAHSAIPSAFWVSEPDSGYSVDNLAPAIPLGISGEQFYSPEGLSITWDPNTESDLSCYNLYKGLSESFEPGPGNLLTSVPDTTTFDDTWSWDGEYYYKLAAVDIHGNESGYALLAPTGVTGEDLPDAPLATYLAQNYPNPFNPSTTIKFGLSLNSHVSLKIYDTAGRLVRVVVEEIRPAGNYTEQWDGLNSRGVPVSSGVYYYRLVSEDFDQTSKMVMLR